MANADNSLGLRRFLQANPVASPEERQELIKSYFLNYGKQGGGGSSMFPNGMVPGGSFVMDEPVRNPGPNGLEGTMTGNWAPANHTIEDVQMIDGADGVPEVTKINYVTSKGERFIFDPRTGAKQFNPSVKEDWGKQNQKTGNPRVPLNQYDMQQGTDRNPFKHPVKYVSELLFGPNEDTVSDQTLPFSSKWTPEENKSFQQTGQIPAGRDARDLNGTGYQPWVNKSTLGRQEPATIKNDGVINTVWDSPVNPFGLAVKAVNAPADMMHNGVPIPGAQTARDMIQSVIPSDDWDNVLGAATPSGIKPAYETNARGQGYPTQPESHTFLTPVKGAPDDGAMMTGLKGLTNLGVSAGQLAGGLLEFVPSPLGALTMGSGVMANSALKGSVAAQTALATARATAAAAATPAEMAAAKLGLEAATRAATAANVMSAGGQAASAGLQGHFVGDMTKGALQGGEAMVNQFTGDNVPVYNKELGGYQNRGTMDLPAALHELGNAAGSAFFAKQIAGHAYGNAKNALMPERAAINGALGDALALPSEAQMSKWGKDRSDFLIANGWLGSAAPGNEVAPNYRPSFEPQGNTPSLYIDKNDNVVTGANTSPELGEASGIRPAAAPPEKSEGYLKARAILAAQQGPLNQPMEVLHPQTLAEVVKKAAEPKYELTPEQERARLRRPIGQGETPIDPEYQRMRGIADIIGNERVDMANLVAGPGSGRARGVDRNLDPKIAAAEAAQRAALGLKPGEPLPKGIPGGTSADKSAAEKAASTGPVLTGPETARTPINDREYDIATALGDGTDFLDNSSRGAVLEGGALVDPRNVSPAEFLAAKAQGWIAPFKKSEGVMYWKYTEKGLEKIEQQMDMDGYEVGWRGKEAEPAPAAAGAAGEAPAEKIIMAIDIVKALPPLPEYKNLLTKQLNDIYMDGGRPKNPTKISKSEMARGKVIREKLEEIASKEPAAAPASVADVVAPAEPVTKPKAKPAAPLEPVVEPAKAPVVEPVTATAAPLIDTSAIDAVVPPQPKVNVTGPTARGGVEAPRQRGERGVRTGPWMPDAAAQAAQTAAPQTRTSTPSGPNRVRTLAKPQFSARGAPILSAKQMFDKNEGKLNRLTYSHLKDLLEETVADPAHNPQFAARIKDEMSNRENRFKDTYSTEQEGRNLISGDPVETMTDARLKDVVDNGQARIRAQKEIIAGHNRGDYRSQTRERSQEGKDALRELNRLQYQWQFAKQEQNKRVRVNAGIARPDGSRIVASKERQMTQMRVDPLTGEEKAAPAEKRKPVEALNHARGRFDKLSLDELVAAEAELRTQGRGYADKVKDAIQARLKEGDAVHRRLHGKDADNIPNPRTATRDQLEARIPDLKNDIARLEGEVAEQKKAGKVDPQTEKSLAEARGDLSGFERELAGRDAMETTDIRYEANKNNFKQTSGDIQGTGTTVQGNGYKPQPKAPAPDKAPPIEGRDKDVIRNEGAAAYEAEQRDAASRSNPNPLGLEGEGRNASPLSKSGRDWPAKEAVKHIDDLLDGVDGIASGDRTRIHEVKAGLEELSLGIELGELKIDPRFKRELVDHIENLLDGVDGIASGDRTRIQEVIAGLEEIQMELERGSKENPLGLEGEGRNASPLKNGELSARETKFRDMTDEQLANHHRDMEDRLDGAIHHDWGNDRTAQSHMDAAVREMQRRSGIKNPAEALKSFDDRLDTHGFNESKNPLGLEGEGRNASHQLSPAELKLVERLKNRDTPQKYQPGHWDNQGKSPLEAAREDLQRTTDRFNEADAAVKVSEENRGYAHPDLVSVSISTFKSMRSAKERLEALGESPNPLGLEGEGRNASKVAKTDATLARLRTVEKRAAEWVVTQAKNVKLVERELLKAKQRMEAEESEGKLTRSTVKDVKDSEKELLEYKKYEKEAMDDLMDAQDNIAKHESLTRDTGTPAAANIADRVIEKYGVGTAIPLSNGAKAVVGKLKNATGKNYEVVLHAAENNKSLDVVLRDADTKENVAHANSTIEKDGKMHIDSLQTDDAFQKNGIATGLITQLLKLASEELREIDPAGGVRKVGLEDFSQGGASTKALARATGEDVLGTGNDSRLGTFDQNKNYSRGSSNRGRVIDLDGNTRQGNKAARERFVANEAVYMKLSDSQRRLADRISQGGATVGDILKQIVDEAKKDKGLTSNMTKMADLLLKNSDAKSLSKLVEMNKDQFLQESYYSGSSISGLNKLTGKKGLQGIQGHVSLSQLHLADPKDLMRVVMHEFIHATTSDKINRAIFGNSTMGEFKNDVFGQSGQKYIDRLRAYVRDPASDKGITKVAQAYLKYLSTLKAKGELDTKPITAESLDSVRNAETGEAWKSNLVGQGISTGNHLAHGQYKASNLHEFMAAITEPEFQTVLKGIKMGNTTAWGKMKDALGEIMGITPADSALRHTFDGIMEISRKDLSEFKRGDFNSQGMNVARVRAERFMEEGMSAEDAQRRAVQEVRPDMEDGFGFGKQGDKDLQTAADLRADRDANLAEERSKANSPDMRGYWDRQDKDAATGSRINEVEGDILKNTKEHPLYKEALRNVEDNNLGVRRDARDTNDAVAAEIRRLEGIDNGNYDTTQTSSDRKRFYQKSRRSEQSLGEELTAAREAWQKKTGFNETKGDFERFQKDWDAQPDEFKAQVDYEAWTANESFQQELASSSDPKQLLSDKRNEIANHYNIDPSRMLDTKDNPMLLGNKDAEAPHKDITGPMTEADWDSFEQQDYGSKREGSANFEPNSKRGSKVLEGYLHELRTFEGKTHEQMMRNPEVAHVLNNIENFTKASKEDVVNAIREIGERGDEIVRQLERGDITLRDAVKLAEKADTYTYLRELGDIRDKRKQLFKSLQRQNGNLRKISDNDGRRGNTHAARESKNNLGLEGEGRNASKIGDFARREAQASVNRANEVVEVIKKLKPDSVLDASQKGADIVTMSMLTSGQAHLDKLASRETNPKAREAILAVNDLLAGGRAGDMTRAVKNGFHSKVKSENNILNTKKNRALKPLEFRLQALGMFEQKTLLEEIGRAVVSKTPHADPQIQASAVAFRELYRDMYYLQKNAGIDFGSAGPNYLPRMLNNDLVLKDRQGFVNAAAKAYETTGLDPAEAMDAANSWWYNIQRGNEGFVHDGKNFIFDGAANSGEPSHTRHRVFGDTAEAFMEKYYNRNIMDVTNQYIGRAVKSAMLAKRFGPDFGKYNKLQGDIIDFGTKGEALLEDVNTTVKNQLVPTLIENRILRTAHDVAGLWQSVMFLPKAVISSLGEPFVGSLRTGGLTDGITTLVETVQQATRQALELEPDYHTKLAEDIGVVQSILCDSALSSSVNSRMVDVVSSDLAKSLQTAYFKSTGLHQWTEGSRVASVKLGERFVRRLCLDIDGGGKSKQLSSRYLTELGIDSADHAGFIKYIKGLENLDENTRLRAISGPRGKHAESYRDALVRFSEQVVMDPNRGNKARWANHPLGGMILGLQSYLYAFHENVVKRTYKAAGASVFNSDGNNMSASNRLMLLAPLAATIPFMAFQYGQGFMRDEVYEDPDKNPDEKLTPGQKIGRMFSRSGAYGRFDFPANLFGGFKYDKDPATVAAGPIIGAGSNALKDQMGVYKDTNSPDTNTAERKAAKSEFTFGVAPAAGGVAALLPGKTGRAAGAVLNYSINTPQARSEYVRRRAGEQPEDKALTDKQEERQKNLIDLLGEELSGK